MSRRSRLEAPNHTQVPNAFLDAIMPEIDSLGELKVTLAIVRQTFGWHKDEQELTFSRLMALAGLSRPSVSAGVHAGMARGTIRQRKTDRGVFYSLVIDGQMALGGGKASEPGGKASTPPSQESGLTAGGQDAEPESGKDAFHIKERTKERKETPHKAPPNGLSEKWAGAIERLCSENADRISELTRATYLEPTRLVSLDGGRAVVDAPPLIATSFASRFSHALGALLGADALVVPNAREVDKTVQVAGTSRSRSRAA